MTQNRTISTEITTCVGQKITLKGWFHNLRELGNVNFLILRDGWGLVQCVVDKSIVNQLKDVQLESIICVTGIVVAARQAPNGIELHQCRLSIAEAVETPPPFELNRKRVNATIDTFLNHAQIGWRHPKQKALLQLSAGIIQGFRKILIQTGFTEIQSPKLVGSATEGGANVFTVDYFGKPAFLAQSPQFYKQMMVGVFERVFEVGPVFRAEPHNTSRHINEYVSLDVEFGFIEDHTTVMTMVHKVIEGILTHLVEKHQIALDLLDIALPSVPNQIPTISFSEAQQLIFEQHAEDCRGEPDLAPQHERWLGQWAQQEHQSDFLFVTGYPMEKRPFYTHPDPQNPKYSNSFDLLFKGLELITGGQRLHRYRDYLAVLRERNLAPDKFTTYLETFRYGMPPHGGFAIGLERFLMQLAGETNVKAVTLFPRDMNRLEP